MSFCATATLAAINDLSDWVEDEVTAGFEEERNRGGDASVDVVAYQSF
jgi:hypothetical protein